MSALLKSGIEPKYRREVMLFKKKTIKKNYDKENQRPVIKASICNGEHVWD